MFVDIEWKMSDAGDDVMVTLLQASVAADVQGTSMFVSQVNTVTLVGNKMNTGGRVSTMVTVRVQMVELLQQSVAFQVWVTTLLQAVPLAELPINTTETLVQHREMTAGGLVGNGSLHWTMIFEHKSVGPEGITWMTRVQLVTLPQQSIACHVWKIWPPLAQPLMFVTLFNNVRVTLLQHRSR
jgi:hypothetical protein